MKRIISITLVVLLILSLASCGLASRSRKTTSGKTETQTTRESEIESTSTENTQELDTTGVEDHTTESLTIQTEMPDTVATAESEAETTQVSSEPEQTNSAEPFYNVTIDIDFIENLFFSRYDVDLSIDGEKKETLTHGVDDTISVSLSEGNHTLTFSKTDSRSTKGETTIKVTQDAVFYYQIACYNYEVTVTEKDAGSSIEDDPSGETEKAATEAPEEVKYGIHDSVRLDDLEYEVTSVSDTKVISSYFEDGKTDNNFVVISIKITNRGNRETSVDSNSFTYYVGENSYRTNDAALYLDNGLWLAESIGAGLSKTVKLVFEIPSEHKKRDFLVIQPSWFGDKATIYMKKMQ